jgi:methanogenic corrinoid protein MtbC1
VIVGLPPGGHHEIGALAFAVAARRRGVDVLYLGADIPLTSWLTAVETSLAPIVVVGVVAASDRAAAAEVVSALRTASRPPVAVLGGARAHEVGARSSVVLPSSLDDAVTTVLGLISPAT